MADKTHLIVSGVARSGTTALAELLNAHPQIGIGIERYKFRYLRENVYDPGFFAKDRFFDFQPGDTNLRPDQRPAWAPVYDAIAAKWDTARVIGDKVPDLTPVLEDFLDAQPGTRCLYILRNLKDVGLSWQTRADKPRDKWPQGKNFAAACDSWAEQQAQLQALFDNRPEIKDRFLLIDYDKMYAKETPIEAALRGFLGIDPAEPFSEMLKRHRAFMARRTERKVPPEWVETYKAVDQAVARGLRKEARIQTARSGCRLSMGLSPRLRALATRLLPVAVGYVDRFDVDRVAGWAVDPKDPSRPARLSLHVDGRHEMNVLANLPRDDVAQTGRAPLNCGFDAALPARLRDGAAHRLELRLERDGTLLRGGRLRLTAGDAALVPAPWSASPLDGLCWFDRDRGAVTGWATGTGSVDLAWGEGAATRVVLDREVPGFGTFSQHGFSVPVPPDLADGRTHLAHVTVEGTPLQGSPVRIGLTGTRPILSLIPGPNGTLRIEARDVTGAPTAPEAIVLADGTPLEAEAEAHALTVTLPPETRHVAVTHGEDGAVLARRVVTPGRALEDWSPDLPAPELDAARLDDALCARARDAFDAFCEGPDDRFDPTWYAATAGLPEGTPAQDALAHWQSTGAARGLPPGPGIDEDAARALHPALARAVAEGRVPCAFALELVLGRGALGSLTGLARANRPVGRADPPAVPKEVETPPLPLPSDWQAPSDGVYVAYLARLSDADRAQALADEREMRRDVATVPLAARPLVSIIMPSWNRAFIIAEAIQSVIEQSYGAWELLVCDDASEDRTADVVRGFDDPRIRYMKFLKSNGSGARNNGLRYARGEIIAYLDSDNLWHPLFLDRMLRALEAQPGTPIAYSAYLDTETIGARIHLQEVSRPAFRPVQLAGKNFMDLNSIVHHRRVFDWLGGFDEALPRLQDWDLALRYTSIFRAIHVGRIGVLYRRNIAWGQVTHTQTGSNAQALLTEKSRARLAGDHDRLAIDWPAPPRTTVLLAPPPGARALAPGDVLLARGLADLARAHGPVRTVSVGEAEGFDALPAALLDDPARLSQALAGHVAEGATIAVGPARAALRALPDLDPARVLTLDQGLAGTMLVPLSDASHALPLGAVPLGAAPGTPPSEPGFLVLGLRGDTSEGMARLKALRAGAARIGVALDVPRRGAPDLALRPALILCLREVAQLDPYEFALLQALQARAIPVAVPPEEDPAGFGNQWIEARAAFALTRTDPDWMFEKTAKLLSDAGTLARLSERSALVHAVAFHATQARERLAHALWWVLAR